MAKQASSQTSQSLKDDAVSQALGPDRQGRVRGYGFGATPSKVDGQSHTSNKVTMLEKALLANTEELKELRMLVTSLLAAQSNKGDNKNVGCELSRRQRNQMVHQDFCTANQMVHVGSSSNEKNVFCTNCSPAL